MDEELLLMYSRWQRERMKQLRFTPKHRSLWFWED